MFMIGNNIEASHHWQVVFGSRWAGNRVTGNVTDQVSYQSW